MSNISKILRETNKKDILSRNTQIKSLEKENSILKKEIEYLKSIIDKLVDRLNNADRNK